MKTKVINDITYYVIKDDNDILSNMDISEKTLVFIMTLFTTVGTYCCKDARYKVYQDKILRILIKEDYGRIKTAIELRTKENNRIN